MMNVVSKTVGKQLSEKSDRAPEEDDMLKRVLNGDDKVSEDNLKELYDWYYGHN